jgi:hypothetical protein
MGKPKATDADVMAFLEAVYPGGAHLAAASFDEATVLRDATAAIATAYASGLAAGRAQMAREVREWVEAPDTWRYHGLSGMMINGTDLLSLLEKLGGGRT